MSLLLDQSLVGEVAEYCPQEFLAYYSCLGNGKADACFGEQKKLTSCVKQKAPSFKKIVASCQGEMQKYENCIKSNPEYRTKCFEILNQVRQCASQAVGDND